MNDSATRDADLTRTRILQAAFELFVEKGFAAVTMRELAEGSGVTKSLIHHHFGTKEALWEAVKKEAFERYYQGQKAELEQAQSPDRNLLRSSVMRYFHFLREHPQVVRLFTWAHLEGDSSCSHLDAELVALGADRIRQAQEQGLMRADINPTHVVTIFINACTQWFETREHHADWPGMGTDEQYLDDFLRVFLQGLEPPGTEEPE